MIAAQLSGGWLIATIVFILFAAWLLWWQDRHDYTDRKK